MLVTALPLDSFALEAKPREEKLNKLDYEIERIDGKDCIKVNLPANSVEVVKEEKSPYSLNKLKSFKNAKLYKQVTTQGMEDKTPTKGGAGQKLNWGANVVWNVYGPGHTTETMPFPPEGKTYEAELVKPTEHGNIVIGRTEILSAVNSRDSVDKDTSYQFITTDAYKKGDEKLSLAVVFPNELDQNVLYEVGFDKYQDKGLIYSVVYLIVQSVTSNVYTAEWDTTAGALKPALKGKIVTAKNTSDEFTIFPENGKYGTIVSDTKTRYIDENDKDGKHIGMLKKYDAKGKCKIGHVAWGYNQDPVMSGEFLSYKTSNFDTSSYETTTTDHPLGNRKGMIPAHYAKTANGVGKDKTPPYFYNLVGDRMKMWRFQMKEGLEVKFNTGLGKNGASGTAGQDIGQASTIAYGEKFDSNLKGAFSEATLSIPESTNLVAPTLNNNNVKVKFKGWKLVEGDEKPQNPQKIVRDTTGKDTLSVVQPDYATTDALKAAITSGSFKGFTEKNPVFYAIYGPEEGKAKIEYLNGDDTNNLVTMSDDLKIKGQDYKTEKLGKIGDKVTAEESEAPEFKGYALKEVKINPANGTYADDASTTIKFIYKVKATTEDKSSDQDYIKVIFNANDGHFGEDTEDKTKNVWVYSGKANFKDAKEKVDSPTKDNATFKEWQKNGTKVDDTYTLSTANETFLANYEEKLPGKATVKYLDVKANTEIDTKFRYEEAAKYPAEKEGNQGAKVTTEDFEEGKAPKFVGYEFNRAEVSQKNGVYALPATSEIKVYYNKLADVIKDDTPDTDNDKPEGYVTVTFKSGEHGTLDGKNENVVYYVNPKLDPAKTMADITQPTIKANTGYKVANPKWKDANDVALDTTTQITKNLTYTAQYTDGQDVIPVPDPSNPPEKPEGYLTVTFDLDGKGTTSDTRVFFVNPNKKVKITAPTVTGIGNYEQKTGDEAWNPKFVTKAKYDKNTKFVAQYKFTKDVVPQGPGEDKPVVPDNYKKVEFKQGAHGTILKNQITTYWVNPDKEVDLTEKAPAVQANAEYKHTGWDKELKTKFTNNTDITAQYKKKVVTENPNDTAYVKVDFKAEKHGNIKAGEKKEFWVLKDETVELKTPEVEAKTNYAFEKWDPAVQPSYSENKTHNAVFKYTGKDVVPQNPGENKPDVPKDFVQVVFAQGDHGTIAANSTTTYWVNPAKKVTVTAPTVSADEGWKHVAWTYKLKDTDKTDKEVKTLESVTDTFKAEKTTITAKYLEKVLEEEPQTDKDAYVKVTFKAETNGKLADDKTEKSYWVLKETPVTFDVPTVTPNENYKFIEWKPAVKASYSENTVHKAQYKEIIVTKDPKDKDYVKVTFDPAKQGTIKAGSNAEVWVLKGETINPNDITPQLDIKNGYALEKWDPAVQNKYDKDTTHKAIYRYNGKDVVPQKPGEDKPNVPDNFVKVTFVAGDHGSIANTETYIYWVNPEEQVTLNAPTVVANKDYKHVAWTYKVNNTDKTTSGDNALTTVKDTFTEKETTITAKYLKKVVTENPNDTENYVKVTFKAEEHGDFGKDSETQQLIKEKYVWVLKNTDVKVTAPKVTANKGYKFTEWNPAVKTNYDADTTHIAQYKEKDKVVTKDPKDADYIKVTFNANGGKIGTKDTKDVWVLSGIATFADAKEEVATPIKDKAKFNEWQDKASQGSAVADTKVLSTENETFYATWTDTDVPTTADKVKELFNVEGVDLAAFVGDTLDKTFWKDGVKFTEKTVNTISEDEKTARKAELEKAVVSDLSDRSTEHEVLYPSKGTLQVKFKDGSTITVQQKLYVYGNGSDKPTPGDKPIPKDEVDVTYVAGDNVEHFDNKVVMVKKGTKETELPGKPEAKAKEGYKDLKWTANPAIDATNGIQSATTLTASAVVDHDFAKISFTVNKVWPNDVNDVPTMNFTLYRTAEGGTEEKVTGAEVKEITKAITEAKWDKLAKTNSEGKTYTYSVKETFKDTDAKNDNWILGTMEDDGNGNKTITNKLKTVPGDNDTPDEKVHRMGKLTITKKIESKVTQPQMEMRMVMYGAKAPAAPMEFTFKVTDPYGKEETFKLQAGKSKELEHLLYGEYTIEETDAKGLTPFVKVGDGAAAESKTGKVTLTKDAKEGTVTFTNKNINSLTNPNVIEVKASKVWENGPSTDHTAVDLKLYRQAEGGQKEEVTDVKAVKSRDVSNASKFNYVWKDLPKINDKGEEYTYTVEETNTTTNPATPTEKAKTTVKVGDNTYVVTQEGNTITNTFEVQKTDENVIGKKVWKDVPDGTTPPTVKLELWRKTSANPEGEKAVQNAMDLTNNQADFGKQDKTDANGNAYTYFVKEVFDDANEKANWTVSGEGTLNLTNTYNTKPAPVKYTVTFDNKGHGTKLADQKIEAGKKATEPAALTADGFDFGGWYTDENFEYKYDFATPVYKDRTLYAKWTAKTVTPDPKTDGKLTITKKLENVPVRMMPMRGPAANGEPIKFTFTVIKPDGTSENFELTANGSKTLENLAYGEYTIKETDTKGYTPFYALGEDEAKQAQEFKVTISGSDEVKVTVTNKNIINQNDITVRATKIWVGGPETDHTAVTLTLKRTSAKAGSTEETVTNAYKVETINGNNSDTITYVWSNLPKHDSEGYAYTYRVEELGTVSGTTSTDKIYKVGSNEYVSKVEGDTSNTANVTTAFKITNTYKVPKTDNEVIATKKWDKVENGTTKPEVYFQLQRTADGKTENVGEKVKVEGTENAQGLIEVNFGKQDKTDKAGNVYTFSVKEVDAQGKDFKHDNYDVSYSEDGLTVTNTYKTQVTPPTPQPATFTVTYEKGESAATGTMNPDTNVSGSYNVKENKFIYAEHEFDGWKIKGATDDTKYNAGATINVTSNITLVATWKKVNNPNPPVPTDEKYLLVFSGNGGSPIRQTKNVKDGEYVTGVTTPTRDGYKFIKWVKLGTDKTFDLTQPFNKNMLDNNDKSLMLVAVWEKSETPTPTPTPQPQPQPTPQPGPRPIPVPEYRPWVPIYIDSAKKEEHKLVERHDAYIAGYPDGTVRPDGKITRAEVSAIFARLTENSAPANYSPKFSDVLAYDWFCDSVMKLSNKDIIKGYPDGTFKPNKSITRAEFAVIASKYIKNPKAADETFSDVPMNHWAKDAIAMVKAEGWISGYTDGTFKPDAPITRAEAVSIVNRMFDRAADGEFVREHGFEIKKFNDLTDKHWAYYEIMEAVHTHDYERIDKRTERWEKIVK